MRGQNVQVPYEYACLASPSVLLHARKYGILSTNLPVDKKEGTNLSKGRLLSKEIHAPQLRYFGNYPPYVSPQKSLDFKRQHGSGTDHRFDRLQTRQPSSQPDPQPWTESSDHTSSPPARNKYTLVRQTTSQEPYPASRRANCHQAQTSYPGSGQGRGPPFMGCCSQLTHSFGEICFIESVSR